MSHWSHLAGRGNDELHKRLHSDYIASDRKSMTTEQIAQLLAMSVEAKDVGPKLWRMVLDTLSEVPSLRYQLTQVRLMVWGGEETVVDDCEDIL